MAPESHHLPNCKQASLLTKTSWDYGQSTSAGRVPARDQLPRRHTAHLRRCAGCTPRKLSGRDEGGNKSEGPRSPAPGYLSCSDLEGYKTQAQQSLRLCGVPEYLNLSGLDLGSAYNPGPASDCPWPSNLEPKQCRQGKHTRHERRQTQCGRDTVSTCQCYLFAVFLPPHSTTEQVSLNK